MNFLMDASNVRATSFRVRSRKRGEPLHCHADDGAVHRDQAKIRIRSCSTAWRFYELFFQDAVEASRASYHADETRPAHGQEIRCAACRCMRRRYLTKLIASGYRVAFLRTVEDPAEAKKRGSKSVVRAMSCACDAGNDHRGEAALASESNYLMALARIRSRLGAGIPLPGSTFRRASSASRTRESRLLADILRIEPGSRADRADTVFHDPDLRAVFDVLGRVAVPQPAVLFDSRDGGRAHFALLRASGRSTVSEQLLGAELAAASAAVSMSRKPSSRSAGARHSGKGKRASTLSSDPATRANLELAKTFPAPATAACSSHSRPDDDERGGRPGLARRTADVAADRPGADQPAARFDRGAGHQPRLRRMFATLFAGRRTLPRALSRLALGRAALAISAPSRPALRAARDIGVLTGAALGGIDRSAQHDRGLCRGNCSRASTQPLRGTAASETRRRLRPRGREPELDEMRALRDQSRRVGRRAAAAILRRNRHQVAEDQAQQRAGVLHRGDRRQRGSMTDTMPAGALHFIARPWRMRCASTTTELAEFETKIAQCRGPGAGDRGRDLRGHDARGGREAEAISAALALATIDVSAGSRCLRRSRITRAYGHRSRMFAIEVDATRRGAGLAAPGCNPFVANGCDLSRRTASRARDLAPHRSQHGGKSTFLRQNALIAIMAQTGSFVPAAAAYGVVDRLFRASALRTISPGALDLSCRDGRTAAILNHGDGPIAVILDENRPRHRDLRRSSVNRLGGGGHLRVNRCRGSSRPISTS